MPTQREKDLYDEWILTRERLSTHIERLQLLLAARRAGHAADAARDDLAKLHAWRADIDERAIDFLMPD